jgi:FixJ family two-component response regulator
MDRTKLIAIVDDDESVLESLPDLLRELGFAASAFASAEDFLMSDSVGDVGCAILDVGLPGMTGPELQRELVRRGHAIPVIFITGQSRMPPGLLSRARVDCLFKPFTERDLRAALDVALPLV